MTIQITWMLVVLALYGAGMYMWGYRKALERAMRDMQQMRDEMSRTMDDGK